MRPVTDESCEFVKAMLEPKVSGEAKLKLLQVPVLCHLYSCCVLRCTLHPPLPHQPLLSVLHECCTP